MWPVVDAGLADADSDVRHDVPPLYVSSSGSNLKRLLVPVVRNSFQCLYTSLRAHNAHGLYRALNALLEIRGDTIGNYLQLLMDILSGLLDTAPLRLKLSSPVCSVVQHTRVARLSLPTSRLRCSVWAPSSSSAARVKSLSFAVSRRTLLERLPRLLA